MILCLCIWLSGHVCVFVYSMLGSSGDSEDCAIGSQGLRVPTQKSYSSSETLKAFDQHQDQTRLDLGLQTLQCSILSNTIDIILDLYHRCVKHQNMSTNDIVFSRLKHIFTNMI